VPELRDQKIMDICGTRIGIRDVVQSRWGRKWEHKTGLESMSPADKAKLPLCIINTTPKSYGEMQVQFHT
jgi:hypothetical protein